MPPHGKKPANAAPAPHALPRRLAMALLLLWGVYAAGHVPFWPAMAMTYLVMSGVTYGVYAADKAAAMQGRWRVAESTLHLLARRAAAPQDPQAAICGNLLGYGGFELGWGVLGGRADGRWGVGLTASELLPFQDVGFMAVAFVT